MKRTLTTEVDYGLAVPFFGQEIMTFLDLGFQSLFSGFWYKNLASCRVLEKNGFTEISSVVNDDRFGQKHTGETIRRFNLSCSEWQK